MKKSINLTQNKIPGHRINFFHIILLSAFFLTGCALHPQKFSKDAVIKDAKSDVQELFKDQEPVTKPISLYEAMARGIKYNRENKLKMMESALYMQQSKMSSFDLLPKLTASAGYQGRDDERASSSESYKTGQESLEASISQDKRTKTADITFTWSVLDFGLSYVRAKQKSDKYLMAKEVERKTVHNIIRDVNNAWWQALTAQSMMNKIDPLMIRVEKALSNSEKIEQKRLDSPLKELNYQRSLIEMLRTLQNLRRSLSLAKPRLAALMGLPFNRDFTLEQPKNNFSVTNIDWDTSMMENIALTSRPELMESRYKERITGQETKAELLKLLPNLNFDAGWNWDSNSYLVDSNWIDYGAHVSWNLFNIFKTPSTLDMIKLNKTVSKERKLAMNMSVLMQIHIAKADYIQTKKKFHIDEKAYAIETRILSQIKSASLSRSKSEQALISQELNHLLSGVKKAKSYAELKNNFTRILVSMGVDPVPETSEDNSVDGLAQAIKEKMENWEKPKLSDIDETEKYLPTELSENPGNEEI